MFLLFHIAVPLLLIFPLKKLNIKYNLFWLFIGSVISDVIDKPASFFNIWSGRGVAHTMIFFVATFYILHFGKKDDTKTISYGVGFLIHIIMDFPLPVFLYPFAGEIIFMFEFSVDFSQINFFVNLLLTDVVLIVTELLGFIILIFLGLYVLIKRRSVIINE